MSLRRLVVISGMSGSGKSSALRSFEDIGYYCVDNLPPPLMARMVDLCVRTAPRLRQIAVAVDARTGEFLESFVPALAELRQNNPQTMLLYFDAEDSMLVQRFSETRRPHPLAPRGSVLDGIAAERDLLAPLRELADHVIDTSTFTVHTLREFLVKRFHGASVEPLNIAVTSFAYRRGLLDNADLVFDVRFLPNPYYDPELRELSGLDKPVREFVESRAETREFLDLTERLLAFLLPKYAEEGKTYLTLAFGCTGGRHRSVAVSAMVAEALRRRGYPTTVTHADLDEATARGGARG